MKNWYTTYLEETYRRQDEIKAAEAYRLAKEVVPEQPDLKRHQRLLVALGARLINWGFHLLAHNEAPQRTSLPGLAKESRG